ncbi:gliding motility-associated C-terminal domain-containing protein [Chryseolinea soli]|uniref:T9SS C-terminal target domain-containing protein n=1 Tax=Chryseolinea soli TaxID=2321403 RepID=A0A385SM22_9BACT|nr:gliding motility-associated C-terminal domain-containing protein [Chryseolinea soli]AYB32803.1 T9SS C-terminal target domain-containing protein [Chryseolinea soli]
MRLKLTHFLEFGLFFVTLPVAAQFKTPVANPYGLQLFAGDQICGAFADMDADGDQDAIVSDLTSNITYVLENKGTAKAPAFKSVKTYNYAVPYLDLADIDYDGDVDMIGGDPVKKKFLWRENIGNSLIFKFRSAIQASDYSPFGLVTPSPQDFMKPEMMDLNKDSYLDCLVSAYSPGSNIVYDLINTGLKNPAYTTGAYNPFHLSYLPKPAQRSFIESSDFDADGDLDIFFGLDDGHLLFFENTPVGITPYFKDPLIDPFHFTTTYGQKTLKNIGLDLVDIDDDGDEDLFVFNGTNGDIVFYESASKHPDPPTNLTATATSFSSIHLTWDDNSINEEGYIIERSTDGVNFSELIRTGPNIQTYEEGGLTSGQIYYYRVITFRADETSENSNIASATPPIDPAMIPPIAPLDLVAKAQGKTAIVLTWTDVSNDEEGFGIERSENGMNAFTPISSVTGNSYSDSNVTLGTTYYYKVFSYKGALRSYSNIVEVKFDEAPGPALDIPTLFTPDGDTYNPTWNILNLENYPNHSVEVFDTSGKKVFSSSHYTPESEWDGSSNGKLLPSGTYIYIIKLNNGQQVNKGFITLLHQ